jgi:hypothetical protein
MIKGAVMRRLPSVTAFLAAIAIAAASFHAFADTYQLLRIANESQSLVYGLDDSGAVVLLNQYPSPGCNTNPGGSIPMGPCFTTYVNGVEFSSSLTPPPLTRDPDAPAGPGCPAVPSFVVVSFFACANGHEIYVTDPDKNPRSLVGLFDGPDLANDLIFPADPWLMSVRVNAFGDVVLDDVFTEEIIEAVNLTSRSVVPEPNSLILLGTGVFAVAGSIFGRRV